MAFLPASLTALVGALTKLPGIGPRSAERIALHLVQAEPGEARQLAESKRAKLDQLKARRSELDREIKILFAYTVTDSARA